MTDTFDIEAFGTRLVTVEVLLEAYGRTETISVHTLSWVEWQGMNVQLPYPAVPQTLSGANGAKLPNPNDRGYRQACEAIDEERNYRRLALSLTKAGHQLPGATAEEQAKALRNIDAGVATALLIFLATAANGGRARIPDRADQFHNGRSVDPADVPDVSVDS